MRSPAAAIAWEFRRRHRWGLLALAVYLSVLAAIKLGILVSRQPVRLDRPLSFAFVVVVPLAATFMYFLGVFSFGLAGDLAARRSMYPARLFTLPVTTSALTGWPMLYGTAAMVALWLATRLFALWPKDVDVPVLWPALLAASWLAWTQALTWMPYGLRGLRALIAVLWLSLSAIVVLVALELRAPETVMLGFLAPQVPLAYLAARFAVARARRGEVPDWRGGFAGLARLPRLLSRRRDPFRSPAEAQAWLEWREIGRSLPAWVAIVLPFELSLLFLVEATPVLIVEILVGVLLTPPFLAIFAAAAVGTPNPRGREAYGLSPFLAMRPLTGGALIGAKLKAALGSTVAAWLLVLVAVPLALHLSGTAPLVLEWALQFGEDVGTPRAVAGMVLIVLGLIAETWKQLVQSLYLGLTGRAWLVKGSVFLALLLLFLLGPLLQWIADHGAVRGALWEAVPGILAGLVCVKMAAAVWVAMRLYRGRLLSDRSLVAGAAGWCGAVLALYGVLVWFVDSPFFPGYVLALISILAIPLARLSAAPLALAWNRHR